MLYEEIYTELYPKYAPKFERKNLNFNAHFNTVFHKSYADGGMSFKDVVASALDEILQQYSQSKGTTRVGKFFRSVAKFVKGSWVVSLFNKRK
jgi:hypothetical protein